MDVWEHPQICISVARYGYWGVQNRQWQVWNATESKWIFSPAKQTQLAKLFRLSTPKNMIVPKASAFGSLISLIYNYCHLHSKSVEDHHVWPFFRLLKGICAHVKDTHQRFLIYESVERYQRFLFQILKVWMWQLIWIKTEICIIISAKKLKSGWSRAPTKICQNTLWYVKW